MITLVHDHTAAHNVVPLDLCIVHVSSSTAATSATSVTSISTLCCAVRLQLRAAVACFLALLCIVLRSLHFQPSAGVNPQNSVQWNGSLPGLPPLCTTQHCKESQDTLHVPYICTH